ncbi:hypothetical protein [Cohnella sp. GbtcB17]|nr:hypothetical protein [Cohnella sp. GbtcB17]
MDKSLNWQDLYYDGELDYGDYYDEDLREIIRMAEQDLLDRR